MTQRWDRHGKTTEHIKDVQIVNVKLLPAVQLQAVKQLSLSMLPNVAGASLLPQKHVQFPPFDSPMSSSVIRC